MASAATGERGGQPIYSALDIETGLALRQTEGLLRSITIALNIDLEIHDHTTLSRRGGGLTLLPKLVGRNGLLHLLVDSTGLKIYGEGEWLDQKRSTRSPRRWRKLHLGVDADTQEIVAVELTPDDVGDVSESSGPLDQIDAEVASLRPTVRMTARPHTVAGRHPAAEVIIQPRVTAIHSKTITTLRDRHIATIAKHGLAAPLRLQSPEPDRDCNLSL